MKEKFLIKIEPFLIKGVIEKKKDKWFLKDVLLSASQGLLQGNVDYMPEWSLDENDCLTLKIKLNRFDDEDEDKNSLEKIYIKSLNV